MKEATGELNITVITVVAIAAVGAFFYAFVWPNIQTNMVLSNACSAAGGAQYEDTENDVKCTVGADNKVTCTCQSKKGGCNNAGAKKTCNQ